MEMKLSPHNVVGVGDAENDHAFLARHGVRTSPSRMPSSRLRAEQTW